MSRYPFEEFVKSFLLKVQPPIYSEDYHKRLTRRYSRIHRDLIRYYGEGKISTTSPRTMTVNDVAYHLSFRRSMKHKGGQFYSYSEYSHEVSALIILFDFVGNMAIRRCLIENPALRPVRKHSRLPSLTVEEQASIKKVLDDLDVDDWKAVRSCALVGMMLSTGGRTKELRLANVKDLDVETWEFEILNPKGIDSYADERFVPVLPEFRSVISKYLELLSYNNPNGSLALFPPGRGSNQYLSDNSFRKLLKYVREESGIGNLTFRLTRRTYGQNYLDDDLDIESVSVLMGHASTKTTEAAYCRRRNVNAAENAKKTWKNSEVDNNKPSDDPDKNDKASKLRSAEDGVRTHDLRISLEEVC